MGRARFLHALAATALLTLGGPAGAGDGYLRLEGHGGPVKGVAVSPDGRHALTASFDYSVGLWSLETGAHLAWAEGHEAAVNAVRFLPGGRRALSVGDDFAMVLWDIASGRPLRRFEGHRGKLISLSVAPGGRMAATAGWDGDIGLWDLDTGARTGWLDGHDNNVNDVVFSADGTRLYSASYDGTIRLWDVGTGQEIRTLVSHGFGVNRLALAEARGWLAYGSVDGTIRVIDLATGEAVADLTADRRPILALALSRDGDRLAVGDGEGHIMVIDTAGWTIERDFRAAVRGPVWALAWDAAGARVLAGGLASEAAVWPVTLQGGAEGEDALFAAARQDFQTPPEEMGNGERQFVRKCSICHTLTGDGARRAGPTLEGVFGRPAGSVPGYPYSPALTGSDIVWTAETIDRLFDEGPDHVTPGSKMPMQRITGPQDRADLIAYLKAETRPVGGADGNGSQPE